MTTIKNTPATLERRIAALEGETHGLPEIVPLRLIVDPDNPDRQVQTATIGAERFTRAADESEAEFVARLQGIVLALRRSGKGPVRIIANDLDLAL